MKRRHNPDVLNCLANLSSDEVFTPPEIAKLMLDNLPKEIWEDENTKFLDPVSKTGVFLREITSRLINGLNTKVNKIVASSGILIKYDPGVPLVYLGFGVTLIGSLLSIISTKRLWSIAEDDKNLLHIGGFSNRNFSGFAHEFRTLLEVINKE